METRDNLGIHEEDLQKQQNEGGGIAELFKMMSDDPKAGELLAEAEDGKIMEEALSVMARGEDSPEEIEYWENFGKGLHKEVFGQGLDKWSVFVPLSSAEEPDRRYPLIFCLHGAHNPILMTESYGIVQVAAREECIVICPENENWASIEQLMEIAREKYPVDWSRVYAMGYSFGGFSSSRLGLAHPEIFAGIGMGGMLFANDVVAHDLDGQWYEEYKLTEDMLAKAEKNELAMCLVMGEHEMLGLLPIRNMPDGEAKDGIIPLKPEDKMVSYNNLRRVAGCKPAQFPLPEEQKNGAEKITGISFEDSELKVYHGRNYYFGYNKKNDGECIFETVAIEGMVHWPSPMFGEILWQHLSKFARDTESGQLIRL